MGNVGNWFKDLFGINEGGKIFSGASGFGIKDPWDNTEKDPYPSTNALSDIDFTQYTPEYFEGLYDEALGSAEDRFGSGTGYSAEEWLNQAGGLQDQYQFFDDWMEANGYSRNDISVEQQGLQTLIDQLSNMDQFSDDAYQHGAELLGYGTADEMTADLAAARERQEGFATGEYDYEGLSEEDRALRERLIRSNMKEYEARAQRMVQNSMADTGSTARMLLAADEANSQMMNAELQQQMQLNNDDVEASLARAGMDAQNLDRLVQTRQIGYADYMNMKEQSLNAAMQGYNAKISALLAENQQYLQQHDQDMSLITSQVQQMQNMATVQLGIDSQIIDAADRIYAARVQEIIDTLTIAEAEGMLNPDLFTQIMDYIAAVAPIVGAVV